MCYIWTYIYMQLQTSTFLFIFYIWKWHEFLNILQHSSVITSNYYKYNINSSVSLEMGGGIWEKSKKMIIGIMLKDTLLCKTITVIHFKRQYDNIICCLTRKQCPSLMLRSRYPPTSWTIWGHHFFHLNSQIVFINQESIFSEIYIVMFLQ